MRVESVADAHHGARHDVREMRREERVVAGERMQTPAEAAQRVGPGVRANRDRVRQVAVDAVDVRVAGFQFIDHGVDRARFDEAFDQKDVFFGHDDRIAFGGDRFGAQEIRRVRDLHIFGRRLDDDDVDAAALEQRGIVGRTRPLVADGFVVRAAQIARGCELRRLRRPQRGPIQRARHFHFLVDDLDRVDDRCRE